MDCMPFSEQCDHMVREQMEERGIRNRDVLRALRATPRHFFVPPESRIMAYADGPLAIGHGATISQPYIVALMTQLLQVNPGDRVLEIGTGSGYQAAVLAQLANHVYTIEIASPLANSARNLLKRLGYLNVTVKQGDGYLGWQKESPFDRIIVTAAPPDVPAELVNQLAHGGRMVVPAGSPCCQELIVIEKDANGAVHERDEGPVLFVPMRPGTA